MPATTFEVQVSIDAATLKSKAATHEDRNHILASFQASLDHWIAEQRLLVR